MTDGNWRLGVFIDEAASDEQAEKLGAVFSGAARRPDGGARAADRREPRASSARRSRFTRSGLRHSVRIGDAVDFEIEDVVPFGVESGEPARLIGIFHPAGSELTIAQGDALEHQRVRDRVRGQVGLLPSQFAWAA